MARTPLPQVNRLLVRRRQSVKLACGGVSPYMGETPQPHALDAMMLNPFLWLILTVIDLYFYIILATVVLSWLVAFNVVNARSDEQSAFVHLFTNRWLWAALGMSLGLQALVLYIPALQRAFGTMALSAGDWLRCVMVASTVLWLREASKLIARGIDRRAAAAS